jgi:hypothetical protein
MSSCKPVSTPADTTSKAPSDDGTPLAADDASWYRSMAGALQYLTLIRPDIAYAVQQVCLHMHAPTDRHVVAVHQRDVGARSSSPSSFDLYDHSVHLRGLGRMPRHVAFYVWLRDLPRRLVGFMVLQAPSGFAVFLGDSLVSWSSKRQTTVSRSSAEAEYRGVANVVSECTWLRHLLGELHCTATKATVAYCDNVSSVYMSRNPVHHRRAAGSSRALHVLPASSRTTRSAAKPTTQKQGSQNRYSNRSNRPFTRFCEPCPVAHANEWCMKNRSYS